ncbi:helix-turn-helix domain-containing protein [Paenibacillus larvae]|uniref:Helix-turn-helix domain-containing protein n=1 Tax=Paenibacillus larvae TaxID=1464 RepID=A0AAP5JSF8_9BACL|nr:helix-turn-helix domain-containing protein [Paenibacillus larvae]MCY7476410.1 helix-turn-helix domain-containing protein [Paenibacillus larvae]MCY7491461.1 helix-turn-helix domain-containing protein [Paenibacillus larvae]MCY9565064.1 helix-turn-helix domain-containing protein [Paenibacillus larvae]MCY9566700.1 helix-turn-helix domain-containing protein [Paenibacillus larvae]MCY9571966.1 helix-turn-helix domain-containing protein [Paenibacillus larvae]
MAESLLVPVQPTWRADEPIGLIQNLLQQDKSGELYDTLQVFLAENGEPHRTTERLIIHRNTLRYRLNRITEITGKDPRRFHDLFQLQMALWLYLFRQSDP